MIRSKFKFPRQTKFGSITVTKAFVKVELVVYTSTVKFIYTL